MSVDLVYSAATGRLRAITIPSNGHVGPGEALTTVSDSQYSAFTSADEIQDFINTVTGKTPAGDRYASLDPSANVISVHLADPLCDAPPVPGGSLAQHDTAQPGDVLLSNGKLLPNQPLMPTRRNYNQPLP